MNNNLQPELDDQEMCADGTSMHTSQGGGAPDGTHPSTYGVGQAPVDMNKKVGKITDADYHG